MSDCGCKMEARNRQEQKTLITVLAINTCGGFQILREARTLSVVNNERKQRT